MQKTKMAATWGVVGYTAWMGKRWEGDLLQNDLLDFRV